MIQPPVKADKRSLGLLTPARQRLWLRGVAARCQRGAVSGAEMRSRHELETQQLADQLAIRHAETLAACRTDRQVMLTRWDQSDADLIGTYESGTLAARDQKNRQLLVLRREEKKATAEAQEHYEAEKKRIAERYQQEKPKPAAYEKRQHAQLAALLKDCQEPVAAAKQLAIGRLGGEARLAAVLNAGNEATATSVSAIESWEDSVQRLQRLAGQINQATAQLSQGLPARIVESFYLVLIAIAAALLWGLAIYLVAPASMALWMLGSLPVAIVVGAAVRIGFGVPLRKQTIAQYPAVDQLAAEAQLEVVAAKQWVTAKAKEHALRLKRQRDTALSTLKTTHSEKLAELESKYRQETEATIAQHDAAITRIEAEFRGQYGASSRQLFEEAEQTASTLANRLQTTQAEIAAAKQTQQESQAAEVDRLWQRIEAALSQAMQTASQNAARIESQFPAWSELLEQAPSEATDLRWLPLGDLQVDEALRSRLHDRASQVPASLPLLLARPAQAAVLIDCPGEQMHVAAEIVRGVLWRALTAVAPGRVRLTLLDPVGHGQNFASLVALGDHDPLLIGHRAWSATPQIAARLQELTQHVEDVLQTCLRDRYRFIEDFNRDAGALAEPYRIVAGIGLPAGLNHESCAALRGLIEGGRRCGVFLVLVRDTSQPWPVDLPALPESHVLRLRIDDRGQLRHLTPELDLLPVVPTLPPPSSAVVRLAEQIGQAAVAAQRVEIPLDECVPPSDYDAADSGAGLQIPVGRQGVGRSLQIELGRGMQQHILVAGKTGSGKSTLLHALITAAALRYSPQQLHLYLLDFKKGVEFKLYADERLPHSRVIGIESEREFGRSVLERLDEELQRRGEAFRASGVQELAEYRRQSSEPLPRILLVVDEFQELFTRDDRVAQECTMYLDRLVRQGRSFGMHVVLSSQSLSGAHSLPRATLGQMAIRVALQCSESDAALILGDDNTAARLLSRPGEAIYNDAGGLVEGNQPFQVAWLDAPLHRQRLREIAARHPHADQQFGATVVFEGNRPARWNPALAAAAIEPLLANPVGGVTAAGLLGEAVRIGPPARLTLSDATGRNVLCVADQVSVDCVLATWLSSAVAHARKRFGASPRIILFDGKRASEQDFSLATWLPAAGIVAEVVKPRESEAKMVELAAQLQPESRSEQQPPTLVVINPLERFRDFRQDDSFSFSLDASGQTSAANALQQLLRDGPQAGLHTIIDCGNAETLSRWLPRTSQHDLEIRILGRTSAADSAQLIDTPEAAGLSPATMLHYDDSDGSLEKFRLCDIPAASDVADWLAG
ncbi:FtsK/SpoIIIE domain-containing protein [Planctomycetaceae bacterium SH139]